MTDDTPRFIGDQGRVGDAVGAEQQRDSGHDGYPAPGRTDHRRPSLAAEDGSPTYYDQPAIKEPVWIWSVPAYFYTGGVAAGAALIGAVAQLVDRDGYDGVVRRCRLLAAAGTALGTAFLVHDLGRPTRFLNMLRVFRPTSAMSMGSWTLAASSGTAAAAATLPSLGAPRLADAAGLAAGVLAPPLGTYTAVLVSDTAVPVWQSTRRAMPALFGASALSSATDALDLLDLDEHEERLTRRIGIVAKTGELAAAVTVERAAEDVHERVARPLREGLSGGLWRAAKLATATSLVLSLLPVPKRLRSLRRILSALAGTVGALATRFAVFHAGTASARDPRATFEPQRERSGGAGSVAARRVGAGTETQTGSV